jgi:hypothetical protein
MNYLPVPIDLSHSTFGYNYFSSAIKPSSSFNWYKLRSACQGAPKQSILKTKGRPFSGSVQNGQLLAKGEGFRHQFKAGAKKERAREKRRGKRAISEKQNREIQIQKWVSSIRGRSCKCKRLKLGLDFRYAQHPIAGSRASCGRSTHESLYQSADGRSALSISSASRDGSLHDAI